MRPLPHLFHSPRRRSLIGGDGLYSRFNNARLTRYECDELVSVVVGGRAVVGGAFIGDVPCWAGEVSVCAEGSEGEAGLVEGKAVEEGGGACVEGYRVRVVEVEVEADCEGGGLGEVEGSGGGGDVEGYCWCGWHYEEVEDGGSMEGGVCKNEV